MREAGAGKKSAKTLLLVIVVILLLGYFAFHILQWLFVPYSTEIALFTEEQEIIEAHGFVIRDESTLAYQTGDVLYYPTEDGDHIEKNGVIAEQYRSAADVSARREIERLEKEITQLKRLESNSDRVAVNPEQLQTRASEAVISLVRSMNRGAYQSIERERESALYALNERIALYEGVQNFSGRIQKLREEAERLRRESSESTGQLRAEQPGYFISYVDGYESVFDFEKAELLTPSDLAAAQEASPKPDGDAVGKLVTSYQWYIAMTVSEKDAMRIQKKESGIKLTFTSADGENIPVKLAALNYSADRSEAAVIFRCDYMNKSLARVRSGNMQIVLDAHKGLRIPKQAVRMRQCTANVLQTQEDAQPAYVEREGSYEGVYVRIGERVKWRFISRLYTGSDYIICDVSPQEYDPLSTPLLNYYDEVFVKGRDLEDGQFIR